MVYYMIDHMFRSSSAVSRARCKRAMVLRAPRRILLVTSECEIESKMEAEHTRTNTNSELVLAHWGPRR
jgi:hypothetical protein